MKRRTFLKIGTGGALGGALAACGGSGDDVRARGPGADPGGSPSGAGPGGGATPGAGPVARPWEGKVVTGWIGTALEAVRTARPGPPMAARSLAILSTCMYDAWCAYDAVALPLTASGAGRRPDAERTEANKAIALSYAAYTALVDQFPGQKAAFEAYMRTLGLDPAAGGGDGQPAAIGSAAARAEIAVCHDDGANQLGDLTPSGVPYADYTGYAPGNPPLIVGAPTPLSQIPAPGHWQPLSYTDATGVVRTQAFVGAAWDWVRPFALSSAAQFRPGPPAAPGTSEYLAQARHIVEVQAMLSDEQKVSAEYWADGPGTDMPPGHWLRFALTISQRDRHTLDDDVKLFFALGAALADAAIAGWDAKRAYDSARPITAVRHALHGQSITGYGTLGPAGGLRAILGQEWTPYQPATFPTPPFPEHVSGHSLFSAAAAEVLARFTGSDVFGASFTAPPGSMHVEPGVPAGGVTLSWPTFSAASAQSGVSRVYGGIHFDNANLAGQGMGRRVGAQAFARAQGLWQGQA
ncbi:vanadium-dependent haloperoxidase [Massilia sp. 9096]|uniref:vanadium-dependent haloperoxidase n=1 Tax=Massilia sp. 9096 TaxID=1500894 RepID=UPI00068969B8|nr:vanadium-dependent haloperoxidase [Massilia sp. 9096]